MNYEKKYKEALERAKEWMAGKYGHCVSDTPQEIAEFIFPELKESEDEKLRKEMLQIAKESEDSFYMVLTPNKRETLIAWFEKKGEQIDIANKEYWRGYREGKQEILDKYAELEKQSEHKSVNNVEPKFKAGDWIVTPTNKVLQISNIEGTSYVFNNESYNWEIYYCDKQCHLWTIEDAKDGDILACKNGWTCIFKRLNDNVFSSHCFMDSAGWFCETGGQAHVLDNIINCHPRNKRTA